MKTFKNNLVTVCLAIISFTIVSCDDNESVYGEDNTEEITTDVIDGKNSIVYDQAENRMHVQKALLVRLFS